MYKRMVAPEEPVPESRKMMREPSAEPRHGTARHGTHTRFQPKHAPKTSAQRALQGAVHVLDTPIQDSRNLTSEHEAQALLGGLGAVNGVRVLKVVGLRDTRES
jgi:hypothetical protein